MIYKTADYDRNQVTADFRFAGLNSNNGHIGIVYMRDGDNNILKASRDVAETIAFDAPDTDPRKAACQIACNYMTLEGIR